MPATVYMKDKILDEYFGKQSYTVPSMWYAGICTSVNSTGGISGEPSTAVGYDRVAVVNDDIATVWSSAASGVKTNGNGQIQFGTVTSSEWGTLTYFFLADGSTGGNVCWYTTMASLTASVGMAPYVNTGNLTITISS